MLAVVVVNEAAAAAPSRLSGVTCDGCDSWLGLDGKKTQNCLRLFSLGSFLKK
jgi:hypothetical protein